MSEYLGLIVVLYLVVGFFLAIPMGKAMHAKMEQRRKEDPTDPVTQAASNMAALRIALTLTWPFWGFPIVAGLCSGLRDRWRERNR